MRAIPLANSKTDTNPAVSPDPCTAPVAFANEEKHYSTRLVWPAGSPLLSGSLLDDYRNTVGVLPSGSASEGFGKNADLSRACSISAGD